MDEDPFCRAMEPNKKLQRHLFFLLLAGVMGWSVNAQDMDARAYSRAPVGANFFLITYAHQSGDVLTDSSLPLRDVSVKLDSVSVATGHTFNLAGRQANIAFAIPYVKGKAVGTVFEEQIEAKRSGLGDLRVRFTANLIGGSALSPKEFDAYRPRTLIGASLTVIVPTGQYDPRRLVNIGTNRWSVKPEIGVSHPIGRWTLEAAAGVWFFSPNNNFFGGSKREQKPLASFQGHLIYTIRPRMWVALDGTFYSGGRTVVNKIMNSDAQSNSRYGATLSYPLGKQHAIKAVFANGLTARFGGKLTTFALGWQYTWF